MKKKTKESELEAASIKGAKAVSRLLTMDNEKLQKELAKFGSKSPTLMKSKAGLKAAEEHVKYLAVKNKAARLAHMASTTQKKISVLKLTAIKKRMDELRTERIEQNRQMVACWKKLREQGEYWKTLGFSTEPAFLQHNDLPSIREFEEHEKYLAEQNRMFEARLKRKGVRK